MIFSVRPENEKVLTQVQERFAVQVPELPDKIDMASYSKFEFASFYMTTLMIHCGLKQ